MNSSSPFEDDEPTRRVECVAVSPSHESSVTALHLFDPLQFGPDSAGSSVLLLAHRHDDFVGSSRRTIDGYPTTGERLFHFEIVEEIGRGSFARVYLARQESLANRLVVLKVTAMPGDEPQKLARLRHPNVVPIYSIHENGAFHVICMPYLGRVTLARMMAHLSHNGETHPASGRDLLSTLLHPHHGSEPVQIRESIPKPAVATPSLEVVSQLSYVDACLWLIEQIAAGLAHAHAQGLFHRDLKPANILMTDDGVPMLLDFNTSADVAVTPPGGLIGGTVVYMAPEHLKAFLGTRCAVDARADLYSLGVILYELLTDRMPHSIPEGVLPDAAAQVLLALRANIPPLVRALNPTVTPAVEAIVGKLLAIDPTKRYATADELRDDLQRQLADQPLKHARAGSLREAFRKWCRRHPRWTTAIAVACLAVFGGIAPLVILVVRQAEIERRASEVQRAEAEVQYRRSVDDLQTANALLASTADAQGHAEARDLVREVLTNYAIEGDPDWGNQPAVLLLSPEQRHELRHRLGEALILLTRAEIRRGQTSLDVLRSAVRWNDLAHIVFLEYNRPEVVDRHRAELQARLANRPVIPTVVVGNESKGYFDGLDLALAGRAADALKVIVALCDRDPQNFNAWFVRGMCHDALRQSPEAAAAFSVCIALRPDFPPAHLNRGLARLRQKQNAEAEADLTRALELRPGWTIAILNRGIAREGSKQFQAAEKDYTAAVADSAAPTRTYLLRSRVRNQLGDKAGAAADRQEGLTREPQDPISWLARGAGRIRTNPAAALADFEAAIAADPLYREAYLNKGIVLADYLNRPADAILALDQILDLFPDFVEARAGRAVYAARLGRAKPAMADVTVCLVAETTPFRTYQMAGVYAQLSSVRSKTPGAREEALRLLARAFASGFADFKIVDTDPDLNPLRQDPDFIRVITTARAEHNKSR